MVEINNQRKAVINMPAVAWSEGTDNGRQKRNHGYDIPIGRKLLQFIVTSQTWPLGKLKSAGAGRYQLLSRWWDAYRKQLGTEDFSPKSQDAVAYSRWAWRFTYD